MMIFPTQNECSRFTAHRPLRRIVRRKFRPYDEEKKNIIKIKGSSFWYKSARQSGFRRKSSPATKAGNKGIKTFR